jgi:hypothetical protein
MVLQGAAHALNEFLYLTGPRVIAFFYYVIRDRPADGPPSRTGDWIPTPLRAEALLSRMTASRESSRTEVIIIFKASFSLIMALASPFLAPSERRSQGEGVAGKVL